MRKMFVVAVLALIPFSGIAQDTPTKADGRLWQTYGEIGPQGRFVKSAYVQGAIEGLRAGAVVGYMDGRLDEKTEEWNYLKPCLDKGPCARIPVASLIRPDDKVDWGAIAARTDKVRSKFAPPQNTSILDIVHQMDKFYSDYRNTPVCMIQAVQESIRSLNGKPSSNQELQIMRKGCNP